MNFVIQGRIVPYVRMTRRGKWVDARAQLYLTSKAAVAYQLKERMALRGWGMLPEQTPLSAWLVFTVPQRLHCADIDNLAKAVLDASQGVCFKNDLWIDELHAVRRAGREYACYFTIRERNAS